MYSILCTYRERKKTVAKLLKFRQKQFTLLIYLTIFCIYAHQIIENMLYNDYILSFPVSYCFCTFAPWKHSISHSPQVGLN